MDVNHGIVDLTQDYDQPVAAVFAAWAKADAQMIWGHPGDGWQMRFDHFHFAVGQEDICRFGPVDGPEYVNRNRYLLIQPDQRIVYATSISSDGRLSFAGTVAVSVKPTDHGTRLRLIEQGFYLDGLDDVTGHEAGWDGMLAALGTYLRDRVSAPQSASERS